MENVIFTPHSAALTKDVVAGLAQASAENAIRVLSGKAPSYSPNWEIVQAHSGSNSVAETRNLDTETFS
jgi:phosphoglycerate dehydrogenase-like enzyme